MKGSNTSTLQELASHGYVVASVDHPYRSLYTKDTDGHSTMVNQAFLQEVQDVNAGVYDDNTAHELEHKWLKLCIDDIHFRALGNTPGARSCTVLLTGRHLTLSDQHVGLNLLLDHLDMLPDPVAADLLPDNLQHLLLQHGSPNEGTVTSLEGHPAQT